MKVLVSATKEWKYKNPTGTEREMIAYGDSLGEREFESIDDALQKLRQETGEDDYVVMFYEKGNIEIEIYNNYRE